MTQFPIAVEQAVFNDHDLLSRILHLPVQIHPGMGAGLAHTVDPLDGIQFRQGQQDIQVLEFTDTVQVIDGMSQPLQ